MSTRSAIAIYNPKTETYDAIYCHWDGYPSHQRPILNAKYNTAKAVRTLIAPGSISSLETDKDWDGKPREPGPLYHLDRGELFEDCGPLKNVSWDELKAFCRNSWCEYLYTYVPRWGWKHQAILP